MAWRQLDVFQQILLIPVTVLKGPNALVAGMAPAGSVGGVVMAQTKRANQDLTRASASYEDDGYYKSGFDVARRLGDNKEFGVRVGGSYGQGVNISLMGWMIQIQQGSWHLTIQRIS